jgi:hypothetical protein
VGAAPSRVEAQDGVVDGGLQRGVRGDGARAEHVEDVAAVVLAEEGVACMSSISLRLRAELKGRLV